MPPPPTPQTSGKGVNAREEQGEVEMRVGFRNKDRDGSGGQKGLYYRIIPWQSERCAGMETEMEAGIKCQDQRSCLFEAGSLSAGEIWREGRCGGGQRKKEEGILGGTALGRKNRLSGSDSAGEQEALGAEQGGYGASSLPGFFQGLPRPLLPWECLC